MIKSKFWIRLADHIGNYQDVLNREFPGAKLVNVTIKSRWERILKRFNIFIKVTTPSNLFENLTTSQKLKLLLLEYHKTFSKEARND